MKMKCEYWLNIAGAAVLVAVFSLSGCVSSSDIGVENAVITGDRPAMWHLSDSDTNIYLFGTFHILQADTQWQSKRFDAAMLASTTTYLEADTTSSEAVAEVQQAVQRYGVNPVGVTLSSILGEERAEKLASAAQTFGIPMAHLEPLRPWLASLSITVVAMQQLGLDPEAGADKKIEVLAASQGDQIRYLESGSSQIKVLASLDDVEDFASFDEGIEQLANFDEEVSAMLTAWQSGDEHELEKQIIDTIKDVSPKAHNAVFVNRNANWTAQIEALMAGKGSYFIAVGAGHLVGEDSVVDMLQEEGFSVNRVQ